MRGVAWWSSCSFFIACFLFRILLDYVSWKAINVLTDTLNLSGRSFGCMNWNILNLWTWALAYLLCNLAAHCKVAVVLWAFWIWRINYLASYSNVVISKRMRDLFCIKKKPFAKFALLRKSLSQENLANEDGKDLSFHGKSHVLGSSRLQQSWLAWQIVLYLPGYMLCCTFFCVLSFSLCGI